MATNCVKAKNLDKAAFVNGFIESEFTNETKTCTIQIQIGIDQDWSGCIRVNASDETKNMKASFKDFHDALATLRGNAAKGIFNGMKNQQGLTYDTWVGREVEYQIKPRRETHKKRR